MAWHEQFLLFFWKILQTNAGASPSNPIPFKLLSDNTCGEVTVPSNSKWCFLYNCTVASEPFFFIFTKQPQAATKTDKTKKRNLQVCSPCKSTQQWWDPYWTKKNGNAVEQITLKKKTINKIGKVAWWGWEIRNVSQRRHTLKAACRGNTRKQWKIIKQKSLPLHWIWQFPLKKNTPKVTSTVVKHRATNVNFTRCRA